MSLVSVVIPTHNSETTLPHALESVFAQTYPSVEILVIDDGSTDGTLDVAKALLQSNPRYDWRIIDRGENAGPSAARNEGLRVASGSWVQFLDSDDLLAPTKFARQMESALAAPPDVAAVHSPWMRGSPSGPDAKWHGDLCDPAFAGRDSITYFLPRVRPLLAAAVIRRSVFTEVGGFDEALRFWECEEMCFRIATKGRFEPQASAEPLYLWRMPHDKAYIGHENAKYHSRDVGLAWIDRILDATAGRPLDELQLSEGDRRLLLEECTTWARQLYELDRDAFARYMTGVRTLHPGFHPTGPWYLALASRILSYEGAETLADQVRMLKRVLWMSGMIGLAVAASG